MSNTKNIHKGLLERFLDLLLIALIIFMTLKGGTSGACAACKYQRRRCAADCPLAPYFPAEQPKLFQNVHRLFGVRSIVKILEKLDETQKPEAMKSIIFQSYVRDRSPVYGCLGVTQQLQYMIWLAEEELKAVNSQLQLYRSQPQNGQNQYQNQNQNQNHNHSQMIHELGGDNKQQEDVTSQQLDLGMGLNVNNNQSNIVTPFFSPLLPVSQTQQPQMSYTYSCSEVNNNGYSPPAYNTDSGKEILTNNNNVWGGQKRFLYNVNNGGGFSNQNESCHEMKSNNGVMAIQSQLVNLQMASNHQQVEEDEDGHEYDEIHQFLEIIDDRQSFADSKEAYASSSGGSLKEQIDEIGENELRSAATCFSLTSMN
ncbi:Lateral organ boundaries LOB [Arabidopsis thaliana x Arabidopsis arenosa]|uniref:Lateral organ boundaries LOB n=2 Tax=Arabidopsis thaliana x Arabidopsis arenosa TaxID=1240361 RepID=A0A8T1ZMZ1_9BRAS|nr:Lateral organ boundaries LOB [Arabidopsis thaliana x Arabidopsis arenosa]